MSGGKRTFVVSLNRKGFVAAALSRLRPKQSTLFIIIAAFFFLADNISIMP